MLNITFFNIFTFSYNNVKTFIMKFKPAAEISKFKNAVNFFCDISKILVFENFDFGKFLIFEKIETSLQLYKLKQRHKKNRISIILLIILIFALLGAL